MSKETILIVENDHVTASLLKEKIESFGYTVASIVSTGTDALKQAMFYPPDLALIDIDIEGEPDGIETAIQIKNNYRISTVYLSEDADKEILERAKESEPLGYVTKPLQVNSLLSTLELALFKAKKEKESIQKQNWLNTILQNIGEGVVVFSVEGDIVFCNSTAEYLLDMEKHKILGKWISDLLVISHQKSGIVIDLTSKNLAFIPHKIKGDDYILDTGKKKISVDFNIIPVNTAEPPFDGYILVLNDISERKKFGAEIQKEIDSTYEMQRSVLPENDMFLADVRINCFLQPCTFGAGDLFSFIQINDDYSAFYMLDVMGHGISATITALILHRLLTPFTEEGGILLQGKDGPIPPADVLNKLNKWFYHEKNNQFFTIIYGLLESKTGKCRIAGGGHNSPIFRKKDGKIEILRPEGSVIGFFVDLGLTEVEFTFKKGDRLFLYSDGFIDCVNTEDERFSQKRLISLIDDYSTSSLKDLVAILEKNILKWHGKSYLDDDISLLAIEKV